jgi:hypothetical protein
LSAATYFCLKDKVGTYFDVDAVMTGASSFVGSAIAVVAPVIFLRLLSSIIRKQTLSGREGSEDSQAARDCSSVENLKRLSGRLMRASGDSELNVNPCIYAQGHILNFPTSTDIHLPLFPTIFFHLWRPLGVAFLQTSTCELPSALHFIVFATTSSLQTDLSSRQ